MSAKGLLALYALYGDEFKHAGEVCNRGLEEVPMGFDSWENGLRRSGIGEDGDVLAAW